MSLGFTASTGRVAYADEAPPHHRRLADLDAGGLALEEVPERACIGAAHIEKKETRRHAGLGPKQLGAHIRINQSERDQRRQAQAQRQNDRRRERARSLDRGEGHAPFDGPQFGGAARDEGHAERDEPQRQKGGDGRTGDVSRDRTLRARQNGQRNQRRRRHRCAGDIALARPALALLGQIADQHRHRQVVRLSERRDREGERREQSERDAKRDHARLDRRRERDRQQRPEQPVDGEWDRSAERRAGKRPDQGDNRELEDCEAHDGRAGSADCFENRKRRALAFDETLRRVGDADAADDQRQQSRQRQELREPLEIAAEVGRNIETRARLPAGMGKGPLGLAEKSSDRRFTRRFVCRAHDDAGRPANQRSRLHQSRRVEGRLRNEDSGTQTHAGRQSIRFAGQDGPNREFCVADANDVAQLQVQPSQQRFFRRRAERAVLLGQRFAKRN